MGKIQLLDCTLRDGGYVNDWEFGHDNLVSVFERVVSANVDFIEIGFLDDRRPFDINRSIMPDTDCVEKIYGGLDRKNTLVVGMIDYGTCSLDHIRPRSESFLDGIRVIFKKHLREQALAFCKELKDMGYMVFAQLVSVTSYSDEEMMDLIRIANEVKPYAVSMVDTYGLMHQNNLQHYCDLLNENLDPEIALGYHGHNNFQMGYANCIKMLQNVFERDILVDASIHGMGKSAGNAAIELVAMYMNQNLGTNYKIWQILEAIESNIFQFYTPSTWGYNLYYYIAALHDCHPNYVFYLTNKKTLSMKSIDEILSKLEGEKKLLYDKNLIENLYLEYQTREVDDTEAYRQLTEKLAGRKVLLVGPGANMQEQCSRVQEYCQKENPIVIAINYIPDMVKADILFVTNGKRYVQMASRLLKEDYCKINTSNVTGTADGVFKYTLNFSKLMDPDTEIVDNSLVMLLKALMEIGLKEVALAGFDGYSKVQQNYMNSAMEYDFVKNLGDYLNTYVKSFLKKNSENIKVQFVTDSKYEDWNE